MNKLNSNIINPGKNRAKKGVKVSENKLFLFRIINTTKEEIKKVHAYLGNLNHKIKILKQIVDEVK